MEQPNAQNQVNNDNRPTHNVYVVKDIGGKSNWRKVGAAWEHSDKLGMTQIIHLLDMDITLTLRQNKAND